MPLEPYVTRNPVYAPVYKKDERYIIPYGGSGGGKSIFVAQYVIECCRNDGRENILLVRKYQTDVRDSCYAQVRKCMKAINIWDDCKTRRKEMRITFDNGAQILGVGLDKGQRLKSIEGPTKVHLEEANEISEDNFNEMDRRLRGSHKPNFEIILTFNPLIGKSHWIRDYFFEPDPDKDEDKIFKIRTTVEDNLFSDDEYEDILENLPEKERQIYRYGEFYDVPDPDQLIPDNLIQEAFDKNPDGLYGERKLGIDPARFGGDKISFAEVDGVVLTDLESVGKERTTQTSSRAIMRINNRDIQSKNVVVDTVGITGVTDNMIEAGLEPLEFIAGGSVIEEEDAKRINDVDLKERFIRVNKFFHFNNLRSQAWYWLYKLLKDGLIAFDVDPQSDEGKRLREDLTAPKYRIRGEKRLEVEPKQGRGKEWGLKSRIGRSTDEGDAVVMAYFAPILREIRRTSDHSRVF